MTLSAQANQTTQAELAFLPTQRPGEFPSPAVPAPEFLEWVFISSVRLQDWEEDGGADAFP